MLDPVCCIEPNGKPVLLIEESKDGGVIYRDGVKQPINAVALKRLQRSNAFANAVHSTGEEPKQRERRGRGQADAWQGYWIDLLRKQPRALRHVAEGLGVAQEHADALYLELMGCAPPEPPPRPTRTIRPTEQSLEHCAEQAAKAEAHRAEVARKREERAERIRASHARRRQQQDIEAAIDEQLALAWGRKTKPEPEPTVIVEPAPPPQPPRSPVVVVVDELAAARQQLQLIYRLKGWRIAA